LQELPPLEEVGALLESEILLPPPAATEDLPFAESLLEDRGESAAPVEQVVVEAAEPVA
jgi:hypothetical protein